LKRILSGVNQSKNKVGFRGDNPATKVDPKNKVLNVRNEKYQKDIIRIYIFKPS